MTDEKQKLEPEPACTCIYCIASIERKGSWVMCVCLKSEATISVYISPNQVALVHGTLSHVHGT